MHSLFVCNCIYRDYYHYVLLSLQCLMLYGRIMLYCAYLKTVPFFCSQSHYLQSTLLFVTLPLRFNLDDALVWKELRPSLLLSLLLLWPAAHSEITGLKLLSDISPVCSAGTCSFPAPIPKLFEYSTAAHYPPLLRNSIRNKHSLTASELTHAST